MRKDNFIKFLIGFSVLSVSNFIFPSVVSAATVVKSYTINPLSSTKPTVITVHFVVPTPTNQYPCDVGTIAPYLDGTFVGFYQLTQHMPYPAYDTDTVVTFETGPLSVGSHTINITSLGKGGNTTCFTETPPYTFIISNIPTFASISLNPTSVLTTDNFTANWSGNNNPTNYALWIDSGPTTWMGTATFLSGSPQARGLGIGTHYFYLSACNSAGCSDWSAPAALVVDGQAPPQAPTLNLWFSLLTDKINKAQVAINEVFSPTMHTSYKVALSENSNIW